MTKTYNKNIEQTRKLIVMSFFVSFFAHLLIVSGNWFSEKDKRITNSGARKEDHKLKVILKSTSKARQIVTSEKSNNNEKSKETKYLGEKTQTFLRETSARNIGSFKKAARGSKTGIKKEVMKRSKRVQKKMAKTKTVKKLLAKEQKKKTKFKKKVSFSDLAASKVEAKDVRKKSEALSLSALGLKNGKSKAAGLSANNDFVEDVALGDMTRLNTIEYKYYGFYHRIKQRLEQYWGNSIQKKAKALWRSGRRMPASENKITSLEVTLDNSGRVVQVNIKGSSGVRELDEAAIESFNRAGPFPNPPKGMVKNGQARIQWGFVVKS